jgi:cytoskeletal protein RodZ
MATGIGDTLRAARREHGTSLADAAAETRVRETYLAALEEEDFTALGGDVYVKGFLRSYARYLGVDPDPLLVAYRREHERVEDHPQIAQQPLPPVGPVGSMGPLGARPQPSQAVLIGGAAAAVVIVLLIVGMLSGGDSEEPAGTGPPPATQTPAVPAPTADALNPSAPAEPDPTTPTAEPSAFTSVEVELTITGEVSYVRTEQGSPAIEAELQEGESETFTSDDEVVLRIGDASAVRLVVNGDDLGPLGDPAQVVEVTCAVGETACEIDPQT